MSRTGTIDSCIERSETTEGILAIAGIEIYVAEADVEFEVDVGIFLGQFVKEEIAKWAAPIKASGVTVE